MVEIEVSDEPQAKAQLVRTAIRQLWRTSSDREIARSLGVSNRTVSLFRKRMEADGLVLPRVDSTQSVEARQYEVCTSAVEPAPLNDELYDPIDESAPSFCALVESIREHGILEPIVASADGYILSGHRRHTAARRLAINRIRIRIHHDVFYHRDRDEFLRLLASYNRQRVKTTTEQVREDADNQTATISEWNFDLLPIELNELEDLQFDLSVLGFGPDQLAKIRGTETKPGKCDADDVPTPPEDSITQLGDLWILGDHRLLCGNSTIEADVLRLMDGRQAAIVATDPPYLVDYTGERPNNSGKDWTASYREIDITDADSFFRSVFTNVLRVLAPHGAIYCWHAHKRQALISRVWEDLSILDHQQIVWVKPTPVFGRVFWHFRHEPCMMGWLQGNQPGHDGDQSFNSVWEIDWEGKSRIVGNEHPDTETGRDFRASDPQAHEDR
ncbi:MAG: modification methylase [Planctomycetaceae bacterium]|nr:modification methylase [Planctomycetaceae bacterium]